MLTWPPEASKLPERTTTRVEFVHQGSWIPPLIPIFFVYSSGYANITLVYGCLPSTTPELFGCLGIGICKGPSVLVPVPLTHTLIGGNIGNVSKMEEVLEVNWKEDKSCSDADTNQTTCFSAPPTEAPQKPQGTYKFPCQQKLVLINVVSSVFTHHFHNPDNRHIIFKPLPD